MWPYTQETADSVIFTKQILNGKLHLLSGVNGNIDKNNDNDDDDDNALHFLNGRSKKDLSLFSSGNYYITRCSCHIVMQEWS